MLTCPGPVPWLQTTITFDVHYYSPDGKVGQWQQDDFTRSVYDGDAVDGDSISIGSGSTRMPMALEETYALRYGPSASEYVNPTIIHVHTCNLHCNIDHLLISWYIYACVYIYLLIHFDGVSEWTCFHHLVRRERAYLERIQCHKPCWLKVSIRKSKGDLYKQKVSIPSVNHTKSPLVDS